MVVLLQMKHENYLHKSRYKKVEEMFPRPRDFGQTAKKGTCGNSQDGVPPNTEKSGLRRGELDFLFLHKEHGIIVAEVKSVGWIPGREQTDDEVAKKVQEGLTQLDKADEVLHYLVSDLTPIPRVRKTLILPNVSRERLQALLDNNDLDLKELAMLDELEARETLKRTNPSAVDRVKIHLNGNSNDNRAPFEALVKAATSQKQEAELNDTNNNTAKKGKLFIVADEVDGLFRDFLEGLQKELPDVGLHVWAATYHHKHRPPGMAEKTLSSSLRCPPVVMRRVKTAVSFTNSAIYPFDALTSKNQVPTDGPPELHLSHKGHSEPDAMNCEECGRAIAKCLISDLNAADKGSPGPSVLGQSLQLSPAVSHALDIRLQVASPGGRGLKQHPSVHGVNSPPALKFSDVIVVPDYYQDEHKTLDEVVDPTSGKVSPSNQLPVSYAGCGQGGVPVKVVMSTDAKAIEELARASENCVSVVVWWGVANGLERKVVVSVGEGKDTLNGVSGVLHGASRCTSQLVYVSCPEKVIYQPGRG
nr:hypothetical protein BaRGS_014641 [Batillaria attramentaria]